MREEVSTEEELMYTKRHLETWKATAVQAIERRDTERAHCRQHHIGRPPHFLGIHLGTVRIGVSWVRESDLFDD